MDFGIFGKSVRGQVGRGFAVMCPDGIVRKFRAKAFMTVCDGDGERVEGVELDMPEFMAMGFSGSVASRDGARRWFRPEFLYRNKGDCARGEADRRMREMASLLDGLVAERKEQDKKMNELDDRIGRMRDRIDAFAEECSGSKWWRK